MSKRKKPAPKKPAPKQRGPKNPKPSAAEVVEPLASATTNDPAAGAEQGVSAGTTETSRVDPDASAATGSGLGPHEADATAADEPAPAEDDDLGSADDVATSIVDDDLEAPDAADLSLPPAADEDEDVGPTDASTEDDDTADADAAHEPPPTADPRDGDELEFPSVPSEGRPRVTSTEDDSDLTQTVVWTGSSRSSRDVGDIEDDEVVSSLGVRNHRDTPDDLEVTVNLTSDLLPVQERDDLSEPTRTALPEEDDVTHTSLPAAPVDGTTVTHQHLRGLIEALVFASDRPLRAGELARRTQAPAKEIKLLLGELRAHYTGRGIQLDEVGGAFLFRTNPVYAPFVRELTGQKPVKLTRTQVETLSILAYRQPITRPEIDDIRGVDSGPVLKMLLERDLIKILGKKDEPGRPILYGTTPQFLEFFGIPSLKDLPTLREFTELNDDSKRVVEKELGESYESVQASLADEASELAATNDLGEFEPEPEGEGVPEAAASASRVDEALREIERASLGADADDDGPSPGTPSDSAALAHEEGDLDDDGELDDGELDDGELDDGELDDDAPAPGATRDDGAAPSDAEDARDDGDAPALDEEDADDEDADDEDADDEDDAPDDDDPEARDGDEP